MCPELLLTLMLFPKQNFSLSISSGRILARRRGTGERVVKSLRELAFLHSKRGFMPQAIRQKHDSNLADLAGPFSL
jgi:hypothetical protein